MNNENPGSNIPNINPKIPIPTIHKPKLDTKSSNTNNPSGNENNVNIQVPEITARQRADQLMGYLNHDKAVNEIFGDSFERQYLIYGKTPRQWREYFKISIVESPNTAQCKGLAARLAVFMQEVTFYYAAAEAQLDALCSGETREYTTAFNKLVAEYKGNKKSLPAAKTLETMAGNCIMDIRGAIQNAKIIKNFWKRMIEGLIEVRKNVELATWNNSTQVKQEQYNSGNLSFNQPNRGQFGTEAKAVQQDDWDV